MVTSIELEKGLPVPSCTLFVLKLREWDGIDKPEHTKICNVSEDEAMALAKIGYVRLPRTVEFREPVGVTARDILFIDVENNGRYVSKRLFIRLPAKEHVRNNPINYLDPTDKRLDHPHWFEYHTNLITEDVPLQEAEEFWPDNPAEAVPFW